jgi:hypothetical protein
MTTSIPMQPGITLLACNIPARSLLNLHLVRGHPMFVSVDETDFQGVRWRVARSIQKVSLVPVQTVEVEFVDGIPAPHRFGSDQIIEVHTTDVVAPAAQQ